MSILVSDNIEQDCFNLISMYTDLSYIKPKILENYPNLSKQKQTSVSKMIKSYIEQGNSFYENAEGNILTSSLPLFYSIQNYVKGIYLLKYPNLSLSSAHGLTITKENVEPVDQVGSVTCKVNGRGTFSNVLSITGDKFVINSIIDLKSVFSMLPELREVYYLRYHEEPNLFLIKKQKKDYYALKMLLMSNDISLLNGRDFSLFDENHYHLQLHDGIGTIFIDAAHHEQMDKNLIYWDRYGNMYCTNGVDFGSGIMKISKMTCLYLCFYILSMLTRYYPEKWKTFCESADSALIRKVLSNCKQEILIETLQLLTCEQYVFATRIDDDDDEAELDSYELFDLVYKEAKNRYRRTGRNPFDFK